MKEPTQKQEQEFWEGYGFKQETQVQLGIQRSRWLYPDGTESEIPPPTDLNNLFKYAPRRMTAILWRKIIREWASCLTGDYEEDTLALFWALWQVKEASK